MKSVEKLRERAAHRYQNLLLFFKMRHQVIELIVILIIFTFVNDN